MADSDSRPANPADIRLEPHKPGPVWRWWVNSTLRAVILKLLGLDQEEAFKEQVARNAVTFLKVIDFQNRRIEQLEVSLAFYEKHVESIRYARGKMDKLDAASNGSRILTLDASS